MNLKGNKQVGHIFTNENSEYKLRKVGDNYECWKDGVFKFGYQDKLSFHNYFYSHMLMDRLGNQGYGSVVLVLDIHYKSIREFLKFLDLYGEDWK